MPVPEAALTQPAGSGGVVVDTDDDVDGKLSIAPNYKFFLVHYANDRGAWFVGEIAPGPGVAEGDVGTWWLPKLTPDYEKPGLCLHRTLMDGEPSRNAYLGAHNAIALDGGVVLPRSLGYCVGYPCRDPITRRVGTHYVDPWSTPRPAIRGRQQKFAFDRNRYHQWLLSLVRDGHVEPPPEDLVEELRRRRDARVARREAQHDMPEGKRERLVAEAAAAAEKAQHAQVPEYAAPARRPGGRKKRGPAPTVETE